MSLDLRAPDDADRDRGWTLIETALAGICAARRLEFAGTQVHEGRGALAPDDPPSQVGGHTSCKFSGLAV